ncbi:MAG: tRNA (adenosine(37)-N6)-threonylcarbamoyltransferase complex dimerization subunit type 1 TsaB [Patescibacteria group bacterium]
MKNIVLSIDTSHHNKLIVSLTKDGEKKVFEEAFDYHKSQGVLPLVEKTLKKEGLEFSDLTGIEVNTGPGSFTGLRVGVTIANTLATILQIPLNGKTVGELAAPVYS